MSSIYQESEIAWYDLRNFMLEFHNQIFIRELHNVYKCLTEEGLIGRKNELEKYIGSCPSPLFKKYLDEAYKLYVAKELESPTDDDELVIAGEQSINAFLKEINSIFTYEDIMYLIRTRDVKYKSDLKQAMQEYVTWENRVTDPSYRFNDVRKSVPKMEESAKAWNDLRNYMMVTKNPNYNMFLSKVYESLKGSGYITEESVPSEEDLNAKLVNTPLSYEDIMFTVRWEDEDYRELLKKAYEELESLGGKFSTIDFSQGGADLKTGKEK